MWEVLPLRVGTKKAEHRLRCPAGGLGESCWYLGASSRPDALVHPVGDVGLQPDDGVRTDGDLLGEGSLAHPSVDGGATNANAIQDFRDAEEAWCCGLFWHHPSSCRSSQRKNPEKRPFSTNPCPVPSSNRLLPPPGGHSQRKGLHGRPSSSEMNSIKM